MKKIIAYLSILVSLVLGVIVFAKPSVQSISGGYDFAGAKEYVYQIVNHGETIDDFSEIEDPDAIDEIAKEFETRLQNYGIDKYNIVTEGTDKIRVTFAAKNDETYDYVSNYLTFDGNLSLVTFDGEVVFTNYEDDTTGEEIMFGEKEAYLTYKNSLYPGIVIPLENPKLFQEKAVAHAEEINIPNEAEQIDVSQEGNIYLWTRYDRDHDNFTNANQNENIKEKLVLSFPYNNIWFEENEEDRSSIAFYFNIEGLDENSSIENIDWKLVTQANDRANYYLHLLNASHLNYRVYNLYNNRVDAALETLVNYDLSITPALSQTLLATIVAFAVILVVATFVYRLSGLTTVLSSTLGILFTLFLYNSIGATLTFPALLGFILVSILIYSNSILQSYKLSCELKKGQSVRKAYIDSTSKTNWFSLDLSVIGVLVGIIAYVCASEYVAGLGIFLFFGSLVNFIVQFVINKVSLYFLTSSIGEKHPESLFFKGKVKKEVNQEQVKENINTSNEKVDAITKKKVTFPAVFGIIIGFISLACALCLSIFSGVSTSYKEATTYEVVNNAYIYVKEPNTTFDTIEEIEVVLDEIRYFNESEEYVKVYSDVTSKDYSNYTNPDDSNQSVKFEYVIFTINLSENIDLTSQDRFFIVDVTQNGEEEVVTPTSAGTTLEETFGLSFPEELEFTINEASAFGLSSTFEIGTVALISFVSILVVSIYAGIRHRISAGIATLSITSAFTLIALGIFSILRTPVFNYIAYATIPVMFIISIIISFALCKHHEDLKETKVKEMDVDFRCKVAKDNLVDTKNYIFFSGVIATFVMLCYYGFSTTYVTNTFLLIVFSVILGYVFISTTLVPYLVKLLNYSKKINFSVRLPKSNKKKLKMEHKRRQKGREVEEATFIGIND